MSNPEILKGYGIELIPVAEKHLELLRNWRNDPQVNQFLLDQNYIEVEQQAAWFARISHDPGQNHYVIYYRGIPIGSANIRSRSDFPVESSLINEIGLYVAEPRYRGNILAFAPSLVLIDYCFNKLSCQKLVAKVVPGNVAALKYNENLGYVQISADELIHIELTPEKYEQATATVRQLLSRNKS